jgi:anhydro-N-acetylmuramic acid kinase
MAVMSRLIAGAMSGTSADGVDVAIVRIEGRGLGMSAQLVGHHYRTYDSALRRAIFAVREGGNTALSNLAEIGREISLAYAACVNEALGAAGLKASDIAAVAAHGQTLFHAPPNTIQWLDPALVAAQTGCAVVSDFRRADCAAGGQGAPLVPFADYILFRHPTKNRVLLNIGGIANLTYIPAGGAIDKLIAFDTGPGNCISDWIMRMRDPAGPGFDNAGSRALAAKAWSVRIVNEFVRTPYFDRPPPKSTDGPEMIRLFEQIAGPDLDSSTIEDLLATACVCTSASVLHALGFTLGLEDAKYEMVVGGGGVLNSAIMAGFYPMRKRFRTTDEFGVPSQAKEAIAFAVLGAATLDGEPSNVPSCTGAARRVVLGSITPKP